MRFPLVTLAVAATLAAIILAAWLARSRPDRSETPDDRLPPDRPPARSRLPAEPPTPPGFARPPRAEPTPAPPPAKSTEDLMPPGVAAALQGYLDRKRQNIDWNDGPGLLAMNQPAINETAGILEEAGIPVSLLHSNLGTVFGHLLRLDQFRDLARRDADRWREADETTRAGQPWQGPPIEALRELADLGSAQLTEYDDYFRRDLEFKLGITNDAVIQRLREVNVAPPPEETPPSPPEFRTRPYPP